MVHTDKGTGTLNKAKVNNLVLILCTCVKWNT